MILLCSTILLLAVPAAAQTVGGGYESLDQWDGAASYELFGNTVSGAGDVNNDGFDDIIVGALYADTPTLSSPGMAFVYSGADGSTLHTFSGYADNSQFGKSVSGAGDVNGDGFDDVIVGSPQSSAGAPLGGSAYVFSGADGSILHHWSGPVAWDAVGNSVAGAGDVDGDGVNDVIVGARSATVLGMPAVGAAFVYSGATGTMIHIFTGTYVGELFGQTVSAAGDVNNDGYADLLVASHQASPGGVPAAGAAYVYSGATGALLYSWQGTTDNEWLGDGLGAAGDVDGDGFDDVMIGASRVDQGFNSDVGAAYVYSGATGALLYQWQGQIAAENLGKVSGAGDINADGYDDMLVGSPRASNGAANQAGSVYLYSGLDGALLNRWDGANDYASFGTSIAGAGDLNGDSLPDIVIGSSNTTIGGLSAIGSAYTYTFNPYLIPNMRSVSASAGGTLNLELTFPDAAGLDDYKILISETGMGPATYGVEIPLTQDSLVIDTFFGNYPVPGISNMHGTLDASGNASASLTVPAGIPAALIGRTYYLAAIANQTGQLPEFSSAAMAFLITP